MVIPPVLGTPMETRDGLRWYAMGRWNIDDVAGLPATLGYVPVRRLPRLRNATKLTVDTHDHWKVADLPRREYWDVIDRLTPSSVQLLAGPGKTVFLPPDWIERVDDPFAAYRALTSAPTRKNQALVAFVRDLDLPASVGIVGSALVQGTTERPEVDLVFTGPDLGLGLQRRLDWLLAERRARRDMFCATRVIYDDLCIDAHIDRPAEDVLVLHRSMFERAIRQDNVTVFVDDTAGGWSLPATYGVSGDGLLVSFRLGHRGAFRCGDELRMPYVHCVDGGASWCGRKRVYLLLEDQWVDRVG
jgi:hypothetical protein